MKILSKSTSNISTIASSKSGSSSKTTPGERYIKKCSAVGESSSKRLLARSKSGEATSIKPEGKTTLNTSCDTSEKVTKPCEEAKDDVVIDTGKL